MVSKKDIDGQIARLTRNILRHKSNLYVEYEINNAYQITNVDIKEGTAIVERITIPSNNKTSICSHLNVVNQFLEANRKFELQLVQRKSNP